MPSPQSAAGITSIRTETFGADPNLFQQHELHQRPQGPQLVHFEGRPLLGSSKIDPKGLFFESKRRSSQKGLRGRIGAKHLPALFAFHVYWGKRATSAEPAGGIL